MAQRMNFTDADIVNFLTNVECLEGRFDSMGALVSSCQLTCCSNPAAAYRQSVNFPYVAQPAMTDRRLHLQGLDFNDDLTLGGPVSIGFGKANLSPEVQSALTEVAVSEQVATGFCPPSRREAFSPCDFTGFESKTPRDSSLSGDGVVVVIRVC